MQGYLLKWNTTVADILHFTALSRFLNLCSPSQCSYSIATFWLGLPRCWEARWEFLPLAWISWAAAPWSHFGSGITPQHKGCPSWGEHTSVSQYRCKLRLRGFSHLLRRDAGHARTPSSAAVQSDTADAGGLPTPTGRPCEKPRASLRSSPARSCGHSVTASVSGGHQVHCWSAFSHLVSPESAVFSTTEP